MRRSARKFGCRHPPRPLKTDSASMETNSDRKIKLAQFLKWVGAVQTGGEAKVRIQGGDVTVNGAIETRRGRQLVPGDQIGLDGKIYCVQLSDSNG
jgi:ribosome-associated protein